MPACRAPSVKLAVKTTSPVGPLLYPPLKSIQQVGSSALSSGLGALGVPSSINLLRRPDPSRLKESLPGEGMPSSTVWSAFCCWSVTAGSPVASISPERLPGRPSKHLVGLGNGSCNDADAR